MRYRDRRRYTSHHGWVGYVRAPTRIRLSLIRTVMNHIEVCQTIAFQTNKNKMAVTLSDWRSKIHARNKYLTTRTVSNRLQRRNNDAGE